MMFLLYLMCAEAEEAQGVGQALFVQSVVCSVMDSHEFTHTALNFKMSVTDPAGNTMLSNSYLEQNQFLLVGCTGMIIFVEDQTCFPFLNILHF